MPELPEVEIAKAGITKHVSGNTIVSVVTHSHNLRWPISRDLTTTLSNQIVNDVTRRGKYLLLHCQAGSVLIHLGMTGYLRILSETIAPEKHDHFDLIFKDGIVLRLNDVRRFGSVVWAGPEPYTHKLLSEIGPEPLCEEFTKTYLYQKSRGRKIMIKPFIMDHKVLAGVGNIYANEALFYAGIRPTTPAGELSLKRCQKLVESIKAVLLNSIQVGGTMLDFRDGIEQYGYFSQHLAVYRRNGKPCKTCHNPIKLIRCGQRSMYYCETCQK